MTRMIHALVAAIALLSRAATGEEPPGPIEAATGPSALASLSEQLARESPPGQFSDASWNWRPLPDGLIYRSYLAGMKEPRMAAMFVDERGQGTILDAALGGRLGLLRYGTEDPVRPKGWQIDVEGAAFPRINYDENWDVVASDFRVGVPLTFGVGPFETKFAFYHLSAHLGDEFMIRYPNYPRINYSRHALVWGNSYFLTDDVRLYGEVEWAFYTDGGTKPWACQFGIDYSPLKPLGTLRGAPFFAINSQLRQEVDWGGNLVVQTGWQWRTTSGHLLRTGLQYFNGKSEEYEFFQKSEEKIGVGFWYDF